MPLVGPTPVDWLNAKDARKDEQMRLMMQMAMADRQFQQSQTQQERMYEQQVIRDQIAAQRADAYDRALTEPRPAGPTDLMQNYGFLRDKGYQDQDIPGMILPNMKTGSEGYQYGIDPETASMIEKDFTLPPGTVGKMGARQAADVNQQWLDRRYPKPDTSVPTGQTPIGRQTTYLNTLLQDLEQRRSSTASQANSNMARGIEDPNAGSALSGYENKINILRGALSRITQTGQPIPEKEWKAIDESIIGAASGGYSQMAQEIAQTLGVSPALAEQYIKKAMGK